jgi:hypothetical protein
MRWIHLLLIGIMAGAGCASPKSDQKAKSTKQPAVKASGGTTSRTNSPPRTPTGSGLTVTNGTQVITLTNPIIGKVATVNMSSRFAVLNFALRQLPPIDQRLNVYRQGVKVGEVKVSGPVLNGNIVADLTAGEIQVGDEVRSD